MKKRLFSFRLYADAMKQLRTIGVLCVIALNLVGVLIPLLNWLDSVDTIVTASTVNFMSMNPLIVLVFCAAAPLLTLVLFSFLNKRESSDFYHAIPETRPCLFLSFFAAIATWLLVITASTMAITTAAYSLFPRLYSVNYTSVLCTGLNTFAGGLLIAAAVAVAMSVTGTTFTNVLVALLLIFLPRLLIQLIISAVYSAFPPVSGMSITPLLDFTNNVPVGLIFSVFIGGWETPLTAPSSGVYTLVLAVLYTLLALWLFQRRSSESAGQSAPNRYLQGLYRLLVGLVLSSIATIGAFNVITGSADPDNGMLGSFGVLYLVSFLLMPVFDVLSTRRVKGLFRRNVVSVLLLMLVNAGVFGITFGAYRAVAAYTPRADEITSVRLLWSDESVSYNGTQDYFESKIAQVKLTSPEVRKLVATRLQYSVDLLSISRARYLQAQRDMVAVPVAITRGLSTHERWILVTEEEQNVFSDALSQVNGFKEIYTELPASVSLQTVHFSGQTLSIDNKENVAKLYQTLRDEVKTIAFENWYALLRGDDNVMESNGKYETYSSPRLATFYGRLYEGNEWYSINVPLIPSVLPKTCTEYLKFYVAEQREQHPYDYQEPAVILKDLSSYGDIQRLYIQYFNMDNEYGNVYTELDESKVFENAEAINEWAAALPSNTVIDASKAFCYVNVVLEREIYEGEESWKKHTQNDGYYPTEALPEWLITQLD